MASATIDSLEREIVFSDDRADSLDNALFLCEAVKPAKRSIFDSFEVGAITGVVTVWLIIWALDARLE